MSAVKVLASLTALPRLMFYTSIVWLFSAGAVGLAMVAGHLTRAYLPAAYYQLMTYHGVVAAFGGLFQLMAALSLLRAGICEGKPVRGAIYTALYIALNLGIALIIASIAMGVRTSYTLMFPLPAVGAFMGLWSPTALSLFVWGVVLVLASIIVLYIAALAKLLFFGPSNSELAVERFMGNLSPVGMFGMIPYLFMVVITGTPIFVTAFLIGLGLIGALSLQTISWGLHPVNFNYLFWIFAHNLMEAMGIMALASVYWLIARYTLSYQAEGVPRLYSERLAVLAILFYSTAAVMAFPHHIFTMPSQPIGLSYTGQLASWLTGFGAAFSVFNVLATIYRYGIRITPASLATLLGFAIYIVDGFFAMQLGTVGWAFRLHGTYGATAHLMTILIAVLLIWIGAGYHSHVLLTGKKILDKVAYVHVVLTAVGALGLFYTMAAMGALGIPRRTYPLEAPPELVALLLIFGIVLAVGQVAYIVSFIKRK